MKMPLEYPPLFVHALLTGLGGKLLLQSKSAQTSETRIENGDKRNFLLCYYALMSDQIDHIFVALRCFLVVPGRDRLHLCIGT